MKTKKEKTAKEELLTLECESTVSACVKAFFSDIWKVIVTAILVGLFIGWLFEWKLNTTVLWTMGAFIVLHLLRCIVGGLFVFGEKAKRIENMSEKEIGTRLMIKKGLRNINF